MTRVGIRRIAVVAVNALWILGCVPEESRVGQAAETAGDSGNLVLLASVEGDKIRLGDPILVNVDLVNPGATTATLASVLYVHFEVHGPDGKELKQLVMPTQFAFQEISVEPGGVKPLVRGRDLTDSNLFTEPGRHTVHYSGPSSISSSQQNPIIVDIEPGQMPTADRLIASLLPMCPDDWWIYKSRRETTQVIPNGRYRVRGSAVYIDWSSEDSPRNHIELYLTEELAAPDPSSRGGRSEYLGKMEELHLYASEYLNVPSKGSDLGWGESVVRDFTRELIATAVSNATTGSRESTDSPN